MKLLFHSSYEYVSIICRELTSLFFWVLCLTSNDIIIILKFSIFITRFTHTSCLILTDLVTLISGLIGVYSINQERLKIHTNTLKILSTWFNIIPAEPRTKWTWYIWTKLNPVHWIWFSFWVVLCKKYNAIHIELPPNSSPSRKYFWQIALHHSFLSILVIVKL